MQIFLILGRYAVRSIFFAVNFRSAANKSNDKTNLTCMRGVLWLMNGY